MLDNSRLRFRCQRAVKRSVRVFALTVFWLIGARGLPQPRGSLQLDHALSLPRGSVTSDVSRQSIRPGQASRSPQLRKSDPAISSYVCPNRRGERVAQIRSLPEIADSSAASAGDPTPSPIPRTSLWFTRSARKASTATAISDGSAANLVLNILIIQSRLWPLPIHCQIRQPVPSIKIIARNSVQHNGLAADNVAHHGHFIYAVHESISLPQSSSVRPPTRLFWHEKACQTTRLTKVAVITED